jgi:hypothetical protein
VNIVYFDLGQGEDYIYKGKTVFRGLHQNDLLSLSTKQKSSFSKREAFVVFPEYYLLKVKQFNDNAKDTLNEWIYFLKNSEVRDSFKVKGLKEAGEVLDIMRLPKDEQYGYNRYLDSLHVKASELFSLQIEAEFKAKEESSVEIAINLISNGLEYKLIAASTNLTIEKINELRETLKL